jgi:hypothetical protein
MKSRLCFAFSLLPLAAHAVKVFETVDLTDMDGLTFLPLTTVSSLAASRKASSAGPPIEEPVGECYDNPSPADQKKIEASYRRAEAKYNATVAPSADDRQLMDQGSMCLPLTSSVKLTDVARWHTQSIQLLPKVHQHTRPFRVRLLE